VSNPRCRVRSPRATFPVCVKPFEVVAPRGESGSTTKAAGALAVFKMASRKAKDHRLLTEPPHRRPVSILSAVTTPSFVRGGIDRLREG
jgi:hypothetical protein